MSQIFSKGQTHDIRGLIIIQKNSSKKTTFLAKKTIMIIIMILGGIMKFLLFSRGKGMGMMIIHFNK